MDSGLLARTLNGEYWKQDSDIIVNGMNNIHGGKASIFALF